MIPIKPTPAKATPTRPNWKPSWLLAAPHRLAFGAGACVMALAALWWWSILVAQWVGGAVPWAVSPFVAHALLMSMGFMPLFFTGFLFTAGPKWLGMPEVQARTLLPFVAAYLLGWLLALFGFHHSRAVAGLGVLVVALAWLGLSLRFAALWRASRVNDKVHAGWVVLSSAVGVLAMAVAVWGLWSESDSAVRTAVQVAIWCFLAVVFAVVSHRMIPFFSASALPLLDAWRPMWLLSAMVGMLWFEGLSAVLDLWIWPLASAWRWLQAAFEAVFGTLMLWLAIRWGLVQSLKIRLLAMLHGGFLWLGLAISLQALSHILMALSQDQVSLGLAPLHALTMGYLGATLFAMATRVSSGHSGRPLAADDTAWTLYWVLQLATFLRVVSAIWPAAGPSLLLWSITAWAVATTGWALRYGGWFGRPRVDGRPG